MKRRIITMLALLGALLLSACSVTESTVIASVNGKDITRGQLFSRINAYISNFNMSLEDVKSDKEIYNRLINDTLFALEGEIAALEEADKLGLSALTDAEQKELSRTIDENINQIKAFIRESIKADTKLDGSIDLETRVAEEFDRVLLEQGYTVESYNAYLKDQAIIAKVRERYTKDLTVTEEEAKNNFELSVASQKQQFEKTPELVESYSASGTSIYYYPKGFAYVKYILIPIPTDVSGKVSLLFYEGKTAEAKAELQPALDAIAPKAQEALTKVKAGEDFDTLMAQYSEDPVMKAEPAKSEGVLIGPGSKRYPAELVAAVSSLEKSVDISELIPTAFGYYILRAVKVLPEGAVPFEQSKAEIKETLLNNKKMEEWSRLLGTWLEAIKAKRQLKEYKSRIR